MIRKSSHLLALLLAGCAAEPVTTGGTLSTAPASTAATSSVKIGRDLLPGAGCKPAVMPSWAYDATKHLAQLSAGGLRARLPSGWTAHEERPDLIVISAPESALGVRPVFELFVSPLCKTYQSADVHERIAARGMLELLPQAATADQVGAGRWSGGLGGPVGTSVILDDVELKTPSGERTLVLYVTDLGDTATFGVHAAAVCPKRSVGNHDESPCEKAYFDMLESTQ